MRRIRLMATLADTREELRVAIVGAGLMGRWHAQYAAVSGAEIAAIVDPDPAARATLGKKYGTAAQFADLEACLGSDSVEVVHVCTPSESHFRLVAHALEAGKHVLVEKPVAGSAAETRRLVQLAEQNGVLLNPVHQFPFQHGFRTLLDRLDRLGTPVELSFVTNSAGGTGRKADERRELLFSILPHPLSLFRAVLRTSVAGIGWQVIASTDDDLDLGATHDRTILRARISLRGRPTTNVLTVVGDRATGHVDLFHGFSIVQGGAPSRRTKVTQPFSYAEKLLVAAGTNLVRRSARLEPAYPGLRELIDLFYDAVRRRTTGPIPDAETLEIADVVDRLRA
jgi:predicted dehydrogenase